MKSRRLIAPFALALAAACLSASAHAADDTKDLRWKFEKDKPFYEEITTQTKSTMKVMGTDLSYSMKLTFYWSWLPKEQDAKKNWLIRQRIEAVQMECDMGGIKLEFDSVKEIASITPLSDFFRALVGSEFMLMIGPDSKVNRVEGREEFLKRLVTANQPMEPLFRQILDGDAIKQIADATLGVVPNRPVKTGESWTFESKLNMGAIGTYDSVVKYTYEGQDAKDPARAKISASPTVKYAAPAEAKVNPLPFKVKSAELKCRDARGSALFNVAKGRLTSADQTLKIEGKLTVEIGGAANDVEIEQTQTTTTRISDDNPLTKR